MRGNSAGNAVRLGFCFFSVGVGAVCKGLKLIFNRRDIGIDQVVEQAGLLRIQLLAALGKLQALELRDLVGQSITVSRR